MMGIEIERKYLVADDGWKQEHVISHQSIRQGFLSTDPLRVVRVRVTEDQGFLTVKGAGHLSRPEYEYEIPTEDAEALLLLCKGKIIQKTRWTLVFSGRHWEVDVFEGQHAGLVLAETEMKVENEIFKVPSWADLDVTMYPRYKNMNLALEGEDIP